MNAFQFIDAKNKGIIVTRGVQKTYIALYKYIMVHSEVISKAGS